MCTMSMNTYESLGWYMLHSNFRLGFSCWSRDSKKNHVCSLKILAPWHQSIKRVDYLWCCSMCTESTCWLGLCDIYVNSFIFQMSTVCMAILGDKQVQYELIQNFIKLHILFFMLIDGLCKIMCVTIKMSILTPKCNTLFNSSIKFNVHSYPHKFKV
jgi:hypothetical protein